jgi:hypothetical protein
LGAALQHVAEAANAKNVRVLDVGVVQLAAEVGDVYLHQVLSVTLSVVMLVDSGEDTASVDDTANALGQDSQNAKLGRGERDDATSQGDLIGVEIDLQIADVDDTAVVGRTPDALDESAGTGGEEGRIDQGDHSVVGASVEYGNEIALKGHDGENGRILEAPHGPTGLDG